MSETCWTCARLLRAGRIWRDAAGFEYCEMCRPDGARLVAEADGGVVVVGVDLAMLEDVSVEVVIEREPGKRRSPVGSVNAKAINAKADAYLASIGQKKNLNELTKEYARRGEKMRRAVSEEARAAMRAAWARRKARAHNATTKNAENA